MAVKYDPNLRVRMVALWGFSGPEGAAPGRTTGNVLKGAEFITTPERARQLERKGKAKRVSHVRMVEEVIDEQPVGDQGAQADYPPEPPRDPNQVHPLDGLSVNRLLAMVDSEEWSAEEVLAYEESQPEEEQRKTLLDGLRQRIESGE